MLGWLFPRPPLDPVEKAWVETRMQWLSEQLGLARMLGASVAIPTAEFFAGTCDGTRTGAQQLMARICDHMGIDAKKVDLEICGDEQMQGVVGVYEPGIVRVAQHQLGDPEAIAATIAHELAHSLLPLEVESPDAVRQHEWLTDLVPVFFGLGILIANAVIREASGQEGVASWWSIRRQGYLPARMIGYAMALFATVRGESRPAWQDGLRLDALVTYRSGMRYLRRTSDCLFTLDSARRPRRKVPTAELLTQLASGSPSARVAALWDLADARHAEMAADAVVRCLRDARPPIREEAVKTVARYSNAAHAAIPTLVDLLDDPKPSVRSTSALALGTLAQDPDEVVPPLAALLGDPDPAVVFASASAIRYFEDRGAPAVAQVVAALKTAIIRCDHRLIDALTHALFAIDPDPTDRVMEFFADDLELRQQAVHIMVDALGADSDDDRSFA